MKKLLLIAALLCLMITGAYAADIKTIAHPGDTVFIGEEGLNVSLATGTYTVLNYYTGDQTIGSSAPDKSVPISNAVNFYVSPSDFSGKTGNWYLGNSSTATTIVGLVVADPTLSITAKDRADINTDISGKSVTAGTGVTFRVESNTYVIKNQRGITDGFATIKVRSPDGTTYTRLFTDTATSYALTSLMIDGNPTIWPGTWNTGAKDASGNRYYKAGSYSFWIELALNQIKDNYNYQGKTYTDQKTVTIASDTLSMTSNTASVVRGTGFTVTILGSPNTWYRTTVKNVAAGEQAPTFVENQEGVYDVVNYSANVLTSNSGSRSVGFATNQDTKSKSWTIRAENGTKNDEISVKVEKGHVSIVAAGSNNYYLGDEIKLTGTNTETSTVYLFMTGPNLPSSGGQMTDARTPLSNESSFAQADVLSDNTWKFDWSTDGLNVDSGSYTVYAVATPSNKDHLSDTQYASTSVTIRKPYITADMPSMVAAGDKIIVRGDAAASPNVGVAVWILGKNYVFYDTTSVEDDGKYELEISSGDTSNLYPGQYYVVVQHPMYNGKYDTWPSSNLNEVYGTYPVDGTLLFRIGGAGSLQGTDAAEALRQALDAGANDDIYANLQFVVAQPTINILPISQKMVGDKFTIKGTTNLAIDSEVQVDIVSSSFKPESKTNASEFSGSSGTVKVVRGVSTTLNEFSFDVDTGRYKSDEYIVQAASITTSAYGSALFNVVPYVAPTPTPTPTPVPTPIPTTVVTTVPTPIPVINTTTPTPTPQGAPGFGVVIALGGLAVVGYLVSRKE